MTPLEYTTLAARTECDQMKARARMLGVACVFEGRTSQQMAPIRLNHAAIGIAGEAGELAGAVERWIYYGKELDVTNIKEELGDLMWYIALACNTFELDLEGIMIANIRKLKTRYPEKFTEELADEANRDRAKEREAVEAAATAKEASQSPGDALVEPNYAVACSLKPLESKELGERFMALDVGSPGFRPINNMIHECIGCGQLYKISQLVCPSCSKQ